MNVRLYSGGMEVLNSKIIPNSIAQSSVKSKLSMLVYIPDSICCKHNDLVPNKR